MPTLNLANMQSKLSSVLIKAAQMFITSAKTFANYSTRIPDSLRHEQPVVNQDGGRIVIFADPAQAPHAIAKEYGSGEHRTIGTPGTYKIEPKNAGALKFSWPKFFETGPQGASQGKLIAKNAATQMVSMAYVDHPGSEARPFMDPARRATQNDITALISEEMGNVIEASITDLFIKNGFKQI